MIDPKRQLLRHLIATIAFRGHVAIRDAPPDFDGFRLMEGVRTPGETLAHIGDLIQGSHYLMKGELVYLDSKPLAWEKEVERLLAAVREFDDYLRSDAQLHQPIEKIVQGPIADALTHVGQIVMLRRAAGSPIREESYFTAEITPGEVDVTVT